MVDTALRADRQRHFAKPRLRARIGGLDRRVLGRRLRAAGDERGKRARYCSEPPGSRSSTAVRPFALGAIRASSICPG